MPDSAYGVRKSERGLFGHNDAVCNLHLMRDALAEFVMPLLSFYVRELKQTPALLSGGRRSLTCVNAGHGSCAGGRATMRLLSAEVRARKAG